MSIEFYFFNEEIRALNVNNCPPFHKMDFILDFCNFAERGFNAITELTYNELIRHCRPSTAFFVAEQADNGKLDMKTFRDYSVFAQDFIYFYTQGELSKKYSVYNKRFRTYLDRISPLCLYTSYFGEEYHNIFKAENVIDLLYFDLSQVFEDVISGKTLMKLKICENCGRYFIVDTRIDTKYCENPAPDNPKYACRYYRKKANQKNSIKSDEKKALYQAIYLTLHARVNRHKENADYIAAFDNFKAVSTEYKKAVKNGEKPADEYLEWLKTFKASM